jgi:CBS domain-containing protein
MTAPQTFLATIQPFNLLPPEVIQTVAQQLEIKQYQKDFILYKQEVSNMRGVDILVEGEYESFFYDSAQNKRCIEHHTAGYTYGGISMLLNRTKSLKTVLVKKGTVVYFMPAKTFKEICNLKEAVAHFFTLEFSKRMLDEEFAHFFKRPLAFDDSFIASDILYSKRIESLEYRSILYCTPDTPVFAAAQMMAKHKISCIFIREDDQIIGYATDITLRDNVVGRQVDASLPIAGVMDNPVVSVDAQAFVYEAILLMFQTSSRYLLIKDDNRYIGCISRNKLLSEQAESPLVFIQSVKLALSIEELKRKWETVPQIVHQLLSRGVNASIVNQVISTLSDTILVKVIEGVIAEMGAPPAKFSFMVLGSEGRKEQTLKTDQDNAILYEDKANEQREVVRTYFLAFARKVSERLDHIGFHFCTGGFMASNSKWTHSLSHWKRNYRQWIEDPDPEKGIHFSTFFDCRHIYGDKSLVEELKVFLDEELQQPLQKMFFFMAKNALQYEPPLTFLRRIRTFTKGKQEVFDIKKAMTPLVDLVRLFALRNRVFGENTGERAKTLQQKGVFSEQELSELLQSYYFLMSLRLKKQAADILYNKVEPSNHIDISSLTKIERSTIVEIFKTIQRFQLKVKIEFMGSLQ